MVQFCIKMLKKNYGISQKRELLLKIIERYLNEMDSPQNHRIGFNGCPQKN